MRPLEYNVGCDCWSSLYMTYGDETNDQYAEFYPLLLMDGVLTLYNI